LWNSLKANAVRWLKRPLPILGHLMYNNLIDLINLFAVIEEIVIGIKL
jgi:hypothetical protein